MADSFFFYDLETSGISARKDRIMQFAGQRTTLDLEPIGEPFNILIRLTPDTLPQPEAILITGILPEAGVANGISEAEFADIFNQQIATSQTIFVGYNNLRFDDEFIRFLNYRNFYDAYGWHWQNGNSRFDLLDLTRMTRALRPDGINWPFTVDQKPTNRLELLTAINNIDHDGAHDALSDARATIGLAKLLKSAQPRLFNFLLDMRNKQQVLKLVDTPEPYVYTSSHFSSSFLHTTVVSMLSISEDKSSALVYDLRHDPSEFIELDTTELTKLWRYDPELHATRLPVKTMKFNRCPAIAPLSVLTKDCQQRLDLDLDKIKTNLKILMVHQADFADRLKQVVKKLDIDREAVSGKGRPRIPSVDEQLYDKFMPKNDQGKFPLARELASEQNPEYLNFEDSRLEQLFTLYRARNYPGVLSQEEKLDWRKFVRQKLFSPIGDEPSQWQKYKDHLEELKKDYKSDKDKLNLLDSLMSYGRSIESDYAAETSEAEYGGQ